jgi:hypothetical protein
MKTVLIPLFITILLFFSCEKKETEWIRVNQLGYRINDIKAAVFIGTGTLDLTFFRLNSIKRGFTGSKQEMLFHQSSGFQMISTTEQPISS